MPRRLEVEGVDAFHVEGRKAGGPGDSGGCWADVLHRLGPKSQNRVMAFG
jgi:hypothetical protein